MSTANSPSRAGRSVDEHRAAIAGLMPPPRADALPLQACAGLVLAADVNADVDLPPFDNSAMDGYAVRAEDVAAAGERPCRWPRTFPRAAPTFRRYSRAPRIGS